MEVPTQQVITCRMTSSVAQNFLLWIAATTWSFPPQLLCCHDREKRVRLRDTWATLVEISLDLWCPILQFLICLCMQNFCLSVLHWGCTFGVEHLPKITAWKSQNPSSYCSHSRYYKDFKLWQKYGCASLSTAQYSGMFSSQFVHQLYSPELRRGFGSFLRRK